MPRRKLFANIKWLAQLREMLKMVKDGIMTEAQLRKAIPWLVAAAEWTGTEADDIAVKVLAHILNRPDIADETAFMLWVDRFADICEDAAELTATELDDKAAAMLVRILDGETTRGLVYQAIRAIAVMGAGAAADKAIGAVANACDHSDTYDRECSNAVIDAIHGIAAVYAMGAGE